MPHLRGDVSFYSSLKCYDILIFYGHNIDFVIKILTKNIFIQKKNGPSLFYIEHRPPPKKFFILLNTKSRKNVDWLKYLEIEVTCSFLPSIEPLDSRKIMRSWLFIILNHKVKDLPHAALKTNSWHKLVPCVYF